MTPENPDAREYVGYRHYSPSSTGVGQCETAVVRVVTPQGRQALNPRLDIANKSPDGLEWGYSGSGPAQLAIALIADACGAEYAFPPIFQRFKERIVARLPKEGWKLTMIEVRAVVTDICGEVDLWPALAVEDASPFELAWDACAREDLCDGKYGREFKRVLGEWQAAGEPENIMDFIAEHANHPPSEHGPKRPK
jgi:hypothetical protein